MGPVGPAGRTRRCGWWGRPDKDGDGRTKMGTNPDTRPDYTNRTCNHVMVTCEIITEPENLEEVESQPDWPIWKQAMKVEMDQHNNMVHGN